MRMLEKSLVDKSITFIGKDNFHSDSKEAMQKKQQHFDAVSNAMRNARHPLPDFFAAVTSNLPDSLRDELAKWQQARASVAMVATFISHPNDPKAMTCLEKAFIYACYGNMGEIAVQLWDLTNFPQLQGLRPSLMTHATSSLYVMRFLASSYETNQQRTELTKVLTKSLGKPLLKFDKDFDKAVPVFAALRRCNFHINISRAISTMHTLNLVHKDYWEVGILPSINGNKITLPADVQREIVLFLGMTPQFAYEMYRRQDSNSKQKGGNADEKSSPAVGLKNLDFFNNRLVIERAKREREKSRGACIIS